MHFPPTSQLFHTLMAALFLLAACLPCTARSIRTIIVDPQVDSPEKVFLYDGKQYVEAPLAIKSLSQEITIPGGDLNLVVLPGMLKGDAKVPADAPKISIPEAWNRCILLFFPDPSNGLVKTRVIPLNANPADFPLGSTRIFNVSSAAIFAKFGKEAVKITPGQVTTVAAPRAGFGPYEIAVDCMIPGETKPRALCRSFWQHDPKARQIMFVTPTAHSPKPNMWGVLDRDS